MSDLNNLLPPPSPAKSQPGDLGGDITGRVSQSGQLIQ